MLAEVSTPICFLVAAVLMAFCPVQIVFNTLGPGDTYDTNRSGYLVERPASGGPSFASAAQFTALTSGNLATVDLGLTTDLFPGAVNAFLYGDAAGSPNNLIQSPLGSVTPTAVSGSLASFTVAGSVPVTMGSVYWLVLKPEFVHMRDVWHQSLTTTGSQAVSVDDSSTWS